METAAFPPVHVEPQLLAAMRDRQRQARWRNGPRHDRRTTTDHMASHDRKRCWNGSYWKIWRFQWPITTDNIHYARS